jgi:hypothetical protein
MILVCSILAWGMTLTILWTVFCQVQSGFASVKRLHQVPCHQCQYFTNSHHLKCTVNPHIACSESAINCGDYQPQ